MSKLKEVEKKLRAEIEAAIKDGWRIEQNSITWIFKEERCCCALGAVIRDLPPETFIWDKYDWAYQRLGITPSEGRAIAKGFDSDQNSDDSQSFYALGVRLRKDYCLQENNE